MSEAMEKQSTKDAKKRKVEDAVEAPASSAVKTNADGDPYFDLSSMRRLSIRKFRGNILVDIREYYGDEDAPKPGKKGISLSLDQFHTLRDLIKSGEVDAELEKMGADDD